MQEQVETLRWVQFAAGWGVVVLVLGLVAFFPLRVFARGFGIKSFAGRNGLRWTKKLASLPGTCSDLATLQMGEKPRELNCVAGERGGRSFAIFDHHFKLPSYGSEARAHMNMALTGPGDWYLLKLIDRARDPGFSVAVIECDLPPGMHTALAKNELYPWRVEFGAKASVIHGDGYRSPDEMLEAADRLNSALDAVLTNSPPVRV